DDGVSPLLHHSRVVTEGVARRLGAAATVRLAMRYGQPGIPSVLRTLSDEGVERLLVVPLFPQYSSAATASITDAVAAAYVHHRFQPALRFAPPFFAAPTFISALANSVTNTLHPSEEVFWLFSFHGLPQRFVDQGDPYDRQCDTTARLLAEALRLPDRRWRLSYQSRFGREPWLAPGTAETLASLPGEGFRRVAVLCPGFVADCLETLEEIAVQGRKTFLDAGGEHFQYIPCLNDLPTWVDALSDLTRRELAGWTGQE
ncbi:MAG: ferrochelatase, partial [Magnetococcales bacterium]|nr:ferrochelatase [Magnetococcales bacterium]